MKKFVLFALFMCVFHAANAGDKIKYYFNKPVDTTVATAVKARYLNYCIADTLAAYINRAKYSLDICIYDFEKTLSYDISTIDSQFVPEVAGAIDSAYARGVKVRVIYDGSNANTGLELLTPGIDTMGSPQGSAYTIMHNKFMIIDQKSPNAGDPIVWTGCLNWYYEQFNWDYNNVVIFQDSALAYAYTAEFNMMWGDTGMVKNWATSKYGQFKTDLGLHDFYIEGNHVELYFSPSDNTDAHIQSTIESANTDLYFGQYTFTETTDAELIIGKATSGLNVYGIQDNTSGGYYPIENFPSALGSHYKIYVESPDTLYHNKMLIVDPSDTCSDPLVLTGSHNWSTSANTKNDENTVIIHNDTAANVYLQYLKGSFTGLGGNLTLPAVRNPSCGLAGVVSANITDDNVFVYPNPSYGNISVTYELSSLQNVTIDIYSVTGQKIATVIDGVASNAGRYTANYAIAAPGIYLVRVNAGGQVFTKKVTVIE